MDRQRYLVPMLALLTVWRIALLPTCELSPDESLAWFYTQHSQLWYLEMGPLMVWLVKVSTFIAGSGELGVRLLAPLLALLCSALVWRLCRVVWDDTTAAWTVVLVQVLPGFNMAAISMTTSILSLACLLGYLICLRMALLRASQWNRLWLAAAGCLALAVLADWRNALAWGCTVLAFALSKLRRHHLKSGGFAFVTLGCFLPLAMFVTWNARNDWPTWEVGEAEGGWQVWPNLLRWLVLATPLLAALMVWALRRGWAGRKALGHDEKVLLVFALAFAGYDFVWGPRERWPHTGALLWMVLAGGMLSRQNITQLTMRVPRKIALRSVAMVLAGLQGMFLMRTDQVRSLGINWRLETQVAEERTWRHFLTTDPSSGMMGWEQGQQVIKEVLAATTKDGAKPWFVLTPSWQMAVSVEHELTPDAPLYQPSPDYPRVHVIQQVQREHPHALMGRYDAVIDKDKSFRGRNALFITDATQVKPPGPVLGAFKRYEPLNIVRIMHAGHEVRALKIFACYDYQPPAL